MQLNLEHLAQRGSLLSDHRGRQRALGLPGHRPSCHIPVGCRCPGYMHGDHSLSNVHPLPRCRSPPGGWQRDRGPQGSLLRQVVGLWAVTALSFTLPHLHIHGAGG